MSHGKIGLLHLRSRSQRMSICQWMSDRMVSSELQNTLLPNLVHMVMQHHELRIMKYDCFYPIYWPADLFATTFNRMDYTIISWGVLCKNQIVVFKGQDNNAGSKLYWISMYPIFCATDLLATKNNLVAKTTWWSWNPGAFVRVSWFCGAR